MTIMFLVEFDHIRLQVTKSKSVAGKHMPVIEQEKAKWALLGTLRETVLVDVAPIPPTTVAWVKLGSVPYQDAAWLAKSLRETEP